jgi:LAS superfamily LD-carboxypeptidase LdcB
MHVYELKTTKKSPSRGLQFSIIIALLIIVVIGGFAFSQAYKHRVLSDKSQRDLASSSTTNSAFAYYSGYDFQKIYSQTALPNTYKLTEPPVITGNLAADSRIQQITESRGYSLQAVPKQAIKSIGSNLLQQRALQSWLDLQKLAQSQHIPLTLHQGFETINASRDTFISYLAANHLSTEGIASGKEDLALVNALQHVVPPGYSRHLTGYTLSISCNGSASEIFDLSPCSKWLNANNYLKAKQVGFIPVYADGVGTPSSNPAVAEYSWVGIGN